MATLTTASRPLIRPLARLRNLFRRKQRDPRRPKPGTPEWSIEARRQAKLIADSPGEAEDLEFMDSLYEHWDE